MARRFIAVAFTTVSFLALAPEAAFADVTPPSPSPSLQSIVAPLPASFSAPVNSPFHGNMTLSDAASLWGPDASKALNELELDGFVGAFAVAKADTAAGRVMSDFVIAFTGQKGAIRFMAADNAETKAGTDYKHADPISGVGNNWTGIHVASTSPALVGDGFEFVKGNDLFGVSVLATHDDITPLQLAQAQARAQYDAAPFQTIPSIDWPENQGAASSDQGFSLGSGPEVFIGLAVVLVLLAAGVIVYMRKNELKPEKPKVVQQMTADGQYWFNGTYWIATSEMAPPWAQRSPDGNFWWNGREWLAVPRPQVPAGR